MRYREVVRGLGGRRDRSTIKGTGDASGKLALAMSIALFAFSAAYVLLDDARIRRSMAALMIVTAVVLTLAVVWGITRADGAERRDRPVAHRLGGVLGIGAGMLTLQDAPVDEDIVDDPSPADRRSRFVAHLRATATGAGLATAASLCGCLSDATERRTWWARAGPRRTATAG